jgi:NifU-like protein
MDIPVAETYASSPIAPLAEGEGVAHWKELPTKQKIALLEEVIASEIQPYIALDAGGVRVINLLEDREVIIAYEGSCTSCHSATGSTLHAIQEILRVKVSPDLIVTPDLSLLH